MTLLEQNRAMLQTILLFWTGCAALLLLRLEFKPLEKPRSPPIHTYLTNIKPLKNILLYTSFFKRKDWGFGGFGREPFLKANCPVNSCYITNNKSYLKSIGEFDAVLFHIQNMNRGTIELPDPKERQSFQRYVMFLVESPINSSFFYEKFKSK